VTLNIGDVGAGMLAVRSFTEFGDRMTTLSLVMLRVVSEHYMTF